LITHIFSAWREDDAGQLGAALAYYAAFSITPLLMMILAAAGFLPGVEFTKTHAQQRRLEESVQL
jgi:uncharacterized BrkB/YihY/UPF0761 family membrane protein